MGPGVVSPWVDWDLLPQPLSQSADVRIATSNGRLLGLKHRMSHHLSSIKVERFGANCENAEVSRPACLCAQSRRAAAPLTTRQPNCTRARNEQSARQSLPGHIHVFTMAERLSCVSDNRPGSARSGTSTRNGQCRSGIGRPPGCGSFGLSRYLASYRCFSVQMPCHPFLSWPNDG